VKRIKSQKYEGLAQAFGVAIKVIQDHEHRFACCGIVRSTGWNLEFGTNIEERLNNPHTSSTLRRFNKGCGSNVLDNPPTTWR
jgi:hypothetical protein